MGFLHLNVTGFVQATAWDRHVISIAQSVIAAVKMGTLHRIARKNVQVIVKKIDARETVGNVR